MLTKEEHGTLTCVESRAPVGEVLRRYWHPVAAAAELDERRPIKPVKLLGEDLVVFRNLRGQYGLLGEQCPHRYASFAYGTVDEDGIRCPHHLWKFDRAGRCLEQPIEPTDSARMHRIRQPAYSIEQLAGLLFAYMGPQPAPPLPRWDVLARTDGRRWIKSQPVLDCNWLEPMETSVSDGIHGSRAHPPPKQGAHEEQHEISRFEYGITKKRITPGEKETDPPLIDQHLLLFPATWRRVMRGEEPGRFWHNLEMWVPRDDTHTQVYTVYFEPFAGATMSPVKDPPHSMLSQDAVARETQAAITNSSDKHPSVSDEGILLFRRVLEEQIEAVRQGKDPLGTIRTPGDNHIIELDVTNEHMGLFSNNRSASKSRATVR